MIETRKKIIISSKELFEKYGYKKVSMDEIAKKSNVTKKTIYHYFKDKESLLNEIVDIELNNMIAKVDKYSSKSSNITDFIKETSYYILKYKNNSKLLKKITDEKEELYNITLRIDESIISYIKDKLLILKKEKPKLKFDIDLCAFIIYKVYVSIMFEWKKTIDEEEVIKNITKILETGLLN